MTIDERLEALTMNLELQSREGEAQRVRLDQLTKLLEIDAENIRALARVAEAHERRFEDLEGRH